MMDTPYKNAGDRTNVSFSAIIAELATFSFDPTSNLCAWTILPDVAVYFMPVMTSTTIR